MYLGAFEQESNDEDTSPEIQDWILKNNPYVLKINPIFFYLKNNLKIFLS